MAIALVGCGTTEDATAPAPGVQAAGAVAMGGTGAAIAGATAQNTAGASIAQAGSSNGGAGGTAPNPPQAGTVSVQAGTGTSAGFGANPIPEPAVTMEPDAAEPDAAEPSPSTPMTAGAGAMEPDTNTEPSVPDSGMEPEVVVEPAGPCPADEPCRILPLGDSITDGFGVVGGYRIELFRKALADGHDITFVGSLSNGPGDVDGTPFPRAHEGHSGWTIEQVDGLVPSPALNDSPHIALLHIGTNDMYQGPDGAPGRLATLLDKLLDAVPLVIVSNIIPFPGSASQVDTYNAGLMDVVQERIDAGEPLIFVDQFTDFPTSELDDGVHPNAAGYARMAGVWYTALEPQL